MDVDALTYQLITDGRRLYALWSDGRLLPVARGGQEDGDGDGGDGTSSDGGQEGEGDAGAGGDAGSGDADNKGGDGKDAKTVTMSQAELDELINKRVAKATKAAQDAAKQESDRAKMDEAERLKAEKTDAENAAKAATATANARLVLSDAKVAAVAAGVKADRVDRFMKVVDLSDVEVDDAGNVNAKAVRKAVDKALADVPEFKAAPANGKGGGSGGDMNGNGDKTRATTLEDAVAAKYASS